MFHPFLSDGRTVSANRMEISNLYRRDCQWPSPANDSWPDASGFGVVRCFPFWLNAPWSAFRFDRLQRCALRCQPGSESEEMKTSLCSLALLTLTTIAHAASPTSIGGRTIQLTVSSGTYPFANSGVYRFLPSAVDDLTSGVASGSSIPIQDPDAKTGPRRFYRTVSP